MNATIAVLLTQDGITSGAIYALIALALLIVFTVTRVILVPQGQFVTFSALTFGLMQQGERPATFLFVLIGAAAAALLDIRRALVARRGREIAQILVRDLTLPLILTCVSLLIPPEKLGTAGQIALTLAIVVPLGPIMYRLVFEPMESASVLMLLIVAVAVDVSLGGIGLLLFGSEGARTDPLLDVTLSFGAVRIGGSNLVIVAAGLSVMLGLYGFFGRTLAGKALRATAHNALGARLLGIRVRRAGRLAFTLAALLGALSGILVSSVMTVYYDSGFMIGLKGFIAAIVGGLVSYPAAVAGALAIGLLEAWSAFYASAFKEVIVFTALIPVLMARSMFAPEAVEEEAGE
jgi:branched-chain amino acid transport system permease protein